MIVIYGLAAFAGLIIARFVIKEAAWRVTRDPNGGSGRFKKTLE